MDITTAPRAREEHRTSPASLAVICTGYFMVILDTTVTNVALPAIGRGLHGSVTGLQWVVDAYTLSFAALLLTGGALAERAGGRRVFAAGLVVFAAASAACGVAPSLGVLVAARLVQGAGAAVLVPSSLLLLQAAYPDQRARSRALGLWGAIAGIGAASGPIVGGLLVSAWSWRGVFFLNLPIALAGLAALRYAPVTRPRPRAVDLGGQLLAVTALGTLTAALVEAGRLGWTSPLVLGGCFVSAVAWAAFVAVEHRGADPMLPLRLFGEREFRSGTVVGVLINLGFYGQLFVMSLYFQDIRGFSALQTGLALLPEAALLTIASTHGAAGPDAGRPADGRRRPGGDPRGRGAHRLSPARDPHDGGRVRDGADHARGDLGGDGVRARRPGRDRLRRHQRRPPGGWRAGRGGARVAGQRPLGVRRWDAGRHGHRRMRVPGRCGRHPARRARRA
jgi:MFS transporter, DHA2 family, methylenomycin A resistance protein